MVRIGLVGIGRWGKNILRNLVAMDGAEVTWCCHTGEVGEQQFMADRYPDISLTTDYGTVLNDADVDAVVLATPISTHYDLARQAIEAGKDVFVEKPMCATVEEAEDLYATVASSDRILFVGYIFVNHPMFSNIQEIHDDTPIRQVTAHWQKTGSFTEPLVDNLVCHDLSIGRALFGEPRNIAVDHVYRTGSRLDVLASTVTYGGARYTIRTNRVHPTRERSVTFVTDQDRWVWQDDVLQRFDPETDGFEAVHRTTEEPLRHELQTFLSCVAQRETPLTGAAFGKHVNEDISDLKDSV